MAKIAILGFGTVGSGVLQVLNENQNSVLRRLGQELQVKYICDIRDFKGHPNENLIVNNIDIILNDDEIKLIVETIGGINPAYLFVKQSLQSARHVVTSNKELVAKHGAELLKIAKQNNVCFLFEASVGGGMPLITPLHQCLAANVINEVMGILNGTTNFMLTKMAMENLTFEQALSIAQELGYAETIDPSADVDGLDAQRKIAILASIITGTQVFTQNIPTKGIRDISVADMAAAKNAGYAIKLIAWAKRAANGQICCAVEPCMLNYRHRLSNVDDVYNAVLVQADMLGDVLFYGKGAGKLPTASAVVADIIDAFKNKSEMHTSLFWQESVPIQGEFVCEDEYNFYLRVFCDNEHALNDIYGNIIILEKVKGEILFKTAKFTQENIAKFNEKAIKSGITINNVMKIIE